MSPRDPTIYFGVGALMLVVASAALTAPAPRASEVDPAAMLRQE